MNVPDAGNPPELYNAPVHGPHEMTDSCSYRRIGQESGAETEPVWIYACDS
jgi:hypothetical protein